MTIAAAKTIILSSLLGQREEKNAAAGSAIKPGMLCKLTSTDGEVNVHATSGGAGATLIAIEDEYQNSHPNGGVDQAYSAGGKVFLEYALPGALRYMRLKASENVAIGDSLISGGDGTLIKTTGTPAKVFAIAEEASNVGTQELIKVRII